MNAYAMTIGAIITKDVDDDRELQAASLHAMPDSHGTDYRSKNIYGLYGYDLGSYNLSSYGLYALPI